MIITAILGLATTALQDSSDSIEIKDGFAIAGVMQAGRLPVTVDSIQDQIVHGKWGMPKSGDTAPGVRGGTSTWRHVSAGANGSFGELRSGYFAASVDLPTDRVFVLVTKGENMLYVNGEPRPGDPYESDYLRLPVALHKGLNTFLFSVGRGALQAKLTVPRAPIQIEPADLTAPDVIVGGPKELWAGVVLLNNTEKAEKVSVFSHNSAGSAAMVTSEIPALSFRKVPVKLRVPDGDLGKNQSFEIDCTLRRVLDKANINLEVKKPNETHRETFFSGIDGSLQYFAVNPAQKPADSNALILSLHGAGVEAIGQARAYSNKEWCTLVAPTNRRPYGFDWEDIGRLDALEVLELARKEFPHNPQSIHLTGHSMGGHGTWSIGTLYPDLFASIAPSAAWISFWSYAGGYRPKDPTPMESELFRSMSPSDTLARVNNTLEEKVYILHGDKDDNVPVTEARHMKQVLTDIHADFGYHEEPGAGHWWGDGRCMDWPAIFDQIKHSKLEPLQAIDFTTPSPAVSARDQWVTILEQTQPMSVSSVKIGGSECTTENVHALQMTRGFDTLTIDGQTLAHVSAGSQLIKTGSEWRVGHLADGDKSPTLSGPFKNVLQNRFVFVVGTHGTPEENAWAAEKARYDAETFEYRGNGSVDIYDDNAYNPDWQRNVILYGNAETNSAWKPLLRTCPIQVGRQHLTVDGKAVADDNDLAAMFIYPHKARGKWIMVGAITGTSVVGCRLTDRLALFSSGVEFPDWTIFGPSVLSAGVKGIRGSGFFSNDWKINPEDSAWSQ